LEETPSAKKIMKEYTFRERRHGSYGSTSSPEEFTPLDGSNNRGVMRAEFYRYDEDRGGCCQLGRGEEGNSSNRPELGVACLALEDARNKDDDKPIVLLSDSACLLSSVQKWTGEGKSPTIVGDVGQPRLGRHVRNDTITTGAHGPRINNHLHQDQGTSKRPSQ